MRAVVFGPAPLMQTAMGVFKGRALGAQKVRDEEDRADEMAARDRRAGLDAVSLAHQTITNDLASETLAQKRAKQERANAAAARLRSSEFNSSGWYGQPGDPADPEHDYDADFEKETRIGALKQALVAGGMPEADAEARARWNVDKEALAAEATTRRQAREKQAADIAHVKAQTALEAAKAAVERAGGKEAKATVAAATREARDRRREMQSVLARRPRLSQFKDMGGLDRDAYEEALTNWRADSTERQGAADDAAADLRALVPGLHPVIEPTPAATGNPAHQALALEAQDAIAQIMASALPDAEKQARVRTVNERLAAALQAER